MGFIGDNKLIMQWAAGCVVITTLSAFMTFKGLSYVRSGPEMVTQVRYRQTVVSGEQRICEVNLFEQSQQKIDYVKEYNVVFYVAADNPKVYSLSSNTIEVPSINFRDGYKYITTEAITINVNALMQAYEYDYPDYDWDTRGRINDIALLWEFLVNQQGVNKNIAAAVIGSVCYEGKVGMEQGSYRVFGSLAEAEGKLTAPANGIGYGIVQWTYPKRRKFLLENYRTIEQQFDYDWETTMVLAECCTLVSELRDYKLFNSLTDDVSLMHASGVICDVYENYSGSSSDWNMSNGQYYLTNDNCSGADRYRYSEKVLDHFGRE